MPDSTGVRTHVQSIVEPGYPSHGPLPNRLSGFGEDNRVDQALGCPCELTWAI